MRVLVACLTVCLTACLALALPAHAAPEDPWLRCAARTDAAERLACYDALALTLRKPAAPAPAVSATPAQQAARFGAPEPSAKDTLDAVESQIAGHVEGWGPGQVFQLANGQRWYVADGSTGVMDLKNPKVTIRRAAMGTFRIEFEGSKQSARVKRME